MMKTLLALAFLLTSPSLMAAAKQPQGFSVTIHQVKSPEICNMILMNSPDLEFKKVETIFAGQAEIQFGQEVFGVEEFSLGSMLERGRISNEDARSYRSETQGLEPAQITYVEVNKGIIAPQMGWIMKAKNGTLALLRSVSGQRWLTTVENPLKFTHEPYALPWMRDAGFAKAAEGIAAGKSAHPIRYEFGRASGGDQPHLIAHNLGILAFLAARDAIMHGVSLDQVAIDVHSPTEANTRLYQMKPYSFKLLHDGRSSRQPTHSVLTRPLLELLQQLKPWGYFHDFAQIMDSGNLPIERAFVLYEKLKRYQNYMLDVSMPNSKDWRVSGSITLIDRTLLSRKVEEAFIAELVAAGIDHMLSRALVEKNRRALRVGHTWPEIPAGNPIISGNSAEIMFAVIEKYLHDPKQMQAWLGGTVEFYRQRLASLGVADPIGEISKVSFFTAASRYENVVRRIGFEPFLDPSALALESRYDNGNVPDFKLRASDSRIFVISGKKMVEFWRANPAYQTGKHVKEGFYESEYREYSLE